jgi:Raf kinase inhibitor-like YbhB/YbcL family protein
MRLIALSLLIAGLAAAQAPAPPQQGRGGGGGGRGGLGQFQNMQLTTTAWPDGGQIPTRYSQAGAEISPAIQWSTPPAGTQSFVLIFHDADTVMNGSTDGNLHWLVWNIPATATSLQPGLPDGFEIEGGLRQISISGSRYRGPGAPAAGPLHHYILELYALDIKLDNIKVDAQAPQQPNPSAQTIRQQIMQAMVGHIRGKASYVGLFHRPQ